MPPGRGAVMATRYSGDVAIRVSIVDDGGLTIPATYRATFSHRGERRGFVEVRGLAHITEAIDSPNTYDAIARSALAFAMDEQQVDESDLGYDAAYSPRVTRKQGA